MSFEKFTTDLPAIDAAMLALLRASAGDLDGKEDFDETIANAVLGLTEEGQVGLVIRMNDLLRRIMLVMQAQLNAPTPNMLDLHAAGVASSIISEYIERIQALIGCPNRYFTESSGGNFFSIVRSKILAQTTAQLIMMPGSQQ